MGVFFCNCCIFKSVKKYFFWPKMSGKDDFELNLSPIKKPTASRGRRANTATTGFLDEDPADDDPLVVASPLQSRPVSGDLFADDNTSRPPPPRGRRTGGWADEASRAKTAKSVRMAADIGGIGSDDEEGMPIIPDLDDVRDEDMAFTVADAPSVAVNRVATYKELDNDLLKHVAFATLDDIDLKLLTKRMAPESALKEPDDPWNWDVVFAEVSGELTKEWFPDEDAETEVDSNGNNSKPSSAGDPGGRGPTKDRPYTAFNRFPV